MGHYEAGDIFLFQQEIFTSRLAGMQLNPFLKTLPVYQPGRPIEEVGRELGLVADSIIKVASNENPLGPSPRAVTAMRQAIPGVNLYPDGNAFYLKQNLAAKLGVGPAHLVLGNGSNEIIEFVAHALLGPDTNVVVSQYCFAIYPIVAKLFGASVITVPAKQWGDTDRVCGEPKQSHRHAGSARGADPFCQRHTRRGAVGDG
jgi:histidinol-phosphate/aromatic aminotransferase/cobyric acid decarboxylase-like protein